MCIFCNWDSDFTCHKHGAHSNSNITHFDMGYVVLLAFHLFLETTRYCLWNDSCTQLLFLDSHAGLLDSWQFPGVQPKFADADGTCRSEGY